MSIMTDYKDRPKARLSRNARIAVGIGSTALFAALALSAQNAKPEFLAPVARKSELVNNPTCKDVYRPGIVGMAFRDAAALIEGDAGIAEPADVKNCPAEVKEDVVNYYIFEAREKATAQAYAEAQRSIDTAGIKAFREARLMSGLDKR